LAGTDRAEFEGLCNQKSVFYIPDIWERAWVKVQRIRGLDYLNEKNYQLMSERVFEELLIWREAK